MPWPSKGVGGVDGGPMTNEPLKSEIRHRPPQATRHLLFVQAGPGYELLEREGVPPVEGDEVELDEARFVVTKLGRSPLARDTRPCAYLQAAA